MRQKSQPLSMNRRILDCFLIAYNVLSLINELTLVSVDAQIKYDMHDVISAPYVNRPIQNVISALWTLPRTPFAN